MQLEAEKLCKISVDNTLHPAAVVQGSDRLADILESSLRSRNNLIIDSNWGILK